MSDNQMLEALKRLVEWHGKRGYESPEAPDALLPTDEQEPEIAQAMRVIAKAEGRSSRPKPSLAAMGEAPEIVERVARKIGGARYPAGNGSKPDEAWYWSDHFDHPGNEFAQECREEDLKTARAAIAASTPLHGEQG